MRYPLHQLHSDRDFEELVWDLCRHLLGEGAEWFAQGKDGGRDIRFRGPRADQFPSAAQPLIGPIIVQAKWTSLEDSTFDDSAFRRKLLIEEAPKVIRLMDLNELEHWIVFANRRKNAISSTVLEEELKAATRCSSIHLRGIDEINGWLGSLPGIVRKHKLDFLSPIRVEPQELREVIIALHEHKTAAISRAESKWNFASYPGIAEKNRVNRMEDRYFRSSIRRNSEPHFAAIRTFLQNPRNELLSDRYHESADEIQAKIMTHRQKFGGFDEVLESFCDSLVESEPKLLEPGRKRLVRILLHYMYCNCDVGESGSEEIES